MIICRRPDPLDNQLQEAGGEGGEKIKAHGRTDQSKVVEEVLVDLKTKHHCNLFKEVEELWRVHCNPDRDPKNDDTGNLKYLESV